MAKAVVYITENRAYARTKIPKLQAHFGGADVLTYDNATEAMQAVLAMEQGQRASIQAVVSDMGAPSGSGDRELEQVADTHGRNIITHPQALLGVIKERLPGLTAKFFVCTAMEDEIDASHLRAGVDGIIYPDMMSSDFKVRLFSAPEA
ncbi:MAG: hypothetical protein GC137_09985 [Alphaproteobacteria bacterium]|nr:hypothetical protein [Alphaproteobacteria bacterium]